MYHRKLSKNEIKQLEGYIDYSKKYLRKLKTRKEPNLMFLGEIGEYFPKPGVVLKRVPLDYSQGLYYYFEESIKKFSDILKQGKITKEEALEFKLVEEPLPKAHLHTPPDLGFFVD